jgi:hypothetical protein
VKSSRVRRVYQEAVLLARQFGVVDYDDEDGRWVSIERFPLPAGWDRRATGLLLVLSKEYPHVPPDGFYIDRFIRTRSGRCVDHYFEERDRLNPYADRGWGWFCIHLTRRAWRPTCDVVHGDNLFKLTVLIRAALTEVAVREGEISWR